MLVCLFSVGEFDEDSPQVGIHVSICYSVGVATPAPRDATWYHLDQAMGRADPGLGVVKATGKGKGQLMR